MYIAKQNFKSYMLGEVKKGDEVPFNEAWEKADLIEKSETKPEPVAQLETKPEPKKAKKNK